MTTYKKYADALQLFQGHEDDLDGILDPRNGYAPLMKDICSTALDEDGEENENLKMEQDTWALIQVVVSSRKTELPPYVPARNLHEYTPTSTLAAHIVNASPFLNELIIIREWLHDVTPAPAHPEATTGYWPFTKHAILHSARTAGGARTGLVKEMDPDVVSRGPLAPDDTNFEKNFCQTLFTYIRAGRIEDAYALCHKAHQPWRAASIRGSKLFDWQELSAGDADSEDGSDEDDDLSWRGTRNRRLWKSACIRAALSQSLPIYERVLFAALAPSPQTFAILKSACRTFADHVWATISVICEEKISDELAKLSTYWEGTLDKVVSWVQEEEEEAEEEEWQNEKQEVLAGLISIPVDEGPGPEHPFHVAQLHIMLDRTSSVFDTFAEQIVQGGLTENLYSYVRFFTHLALYYKMIGLPVPPASIQVILEAYLSVLEVNGLYDLVALYAAALGDNAVTRYATFLVHSDPADRRAALNQAREHNLDVDRVAMVAAELTLSEAFEVLPAPMGELPVLGVPEPPTDMQKLLLRSIEWTTLYESTYHVALEQSNAIFRYFLAMGLPHHVIPLLDSLPLDLASFLDDEHLHYRQFFTLWRLFETTTSTLTSLQPHAKENIAHYRDLLADTHSSALKLLVSDWMVPKEDMKQDQITDMLRIRTIYIPEFVFRLHALLFASRNYVNDALHSLLQLTNTVADSRYKIYEAFGARLPQYLTLVRQGVLGTLEGGGSDPFRLLQP